MRFARLDTEGRPIAFYDDGIHRTIPEDAIEISDDHWREALDHPSRRRFDEAGSLVPCDPPSAPPVDSDEARAYVDARLEGDPLLAELVAVLSEKTDVTVDEIRTGMLARLGVETDG